MFISILLLIVGMILLIKGADLFVEGSSKIAKALHIPSLIIGLTLVSLGTSAPEASVSINAAINHLNEMSVSNVIGSNMFNTLFILGASALFTPLIISKEMKRYDIPIMVGIYVILLVFSFVISPYKLDIVESIILLLMLVAYIVFLILRAKKSNQIVEEKTNDEEKVSLPKNIIFVIIGLAAIIFGGDLVKNNAVNIATELNMSVSLISITIVAVGTSLPELVTSIVASIKKENDIAIGNIVGSNIFNIIFILGLSSTLSPLSLIATDLFDMLVMFASGIVLLLIALFSKNVKRWHGILMLLSYIAFIVYLILR